MRRMKPQVEVLRNHRIRTLRAEGKTLREIGHMFGITGQRVQQISTNYKHTRRMPHDTLLQVYFIRTGAFLKIGVAADANRRFNQLQKECPYPLTLLGCVTGKGRPYEAELLQRFRDSLHRGEWLHWTPEVAAFCAERF